MASASKDKVIYVSDDDSPNIAGQAGKDQVICVDDDIPSTAEKRGNKKRVAPGASSTNQTDVSLPKKSRKKKAAITPPEKSQKKKAAITPPEKSQKKKAAITPEKSEKKKAAITPPEKSQKKKAAKVEEKREGRLRTITQAIKDRIARALGQRMFLIERKDTSAEGSLGQEFTVLGSTGNVYKVKIDKHPTCDCPDHMKGNLCKHILFVFLKVLRTPRDSYIICQRALLQDELQEVFSQAPKRNNRVCASAAVRAAFAAVRAAFAGGSSEEAAGPSTDKRKAIDEESCSICFDDFSESDDSEGKVVWCESGCGHNFHKQCMQMWLQSKNEANQKTCPLCRTLWPVPKSAAGNGAGQNEGEEGYVNLGQLQPGVSTERDTSTYSEWGYNRYRRGWF